MLRKSCAYSGMYVVSSYIEGIMSTMIRWTSRTVYPFPDTSSEFGGALRNQPRRCVGHDESLLILRLSSLSHIDIRKTTYRSRAVVVRFCRNARQVLAPLTSGVRVIGICESSPVSMRSDRDTSRRDLQKFLIVKTNPRITRTSAIARSTQTMIAFFFVGLEDNVCEGPISGQRRGGQKSRRPAHSIAGIKIIPHKRPIA